MYIMSIETMYVLMYNIITVKEKMAEAKRGEKKALGRGLDRLNYFSGIVNSIAETSGYPDGTKITMNLQEALEPQIPVRPNHVGKSHPYYFPKGHRVVPRSSTR